jgi:hypothetical protein
MKHAISRLTILMFFTCLFLIFNQTAFASGLNSNTPIASKEVKAMVESDFAKYQKSLDNSKDNFGASNEETFSNAQLKDGIAYYMVSNNTDTNDNGFTFAGYIFPIQLNGKPVGIVSATENNGKWQVLDISNNLTFDQDLSDAKKLLKNTDRTKLVYDSFAGLKLLLVQSETGASTVLPLKDNKALNLKKNNSVSMSDFQARFQKLKNKKGSTNQSQGDQLGGIGGVGVSSTTQSSSYFLTIGVVVVVTFGAILYFIARKRKNMI